MRVTFWGAARTVTGSKHLLAGRPGNVLLDCGLFQGRRAESEARNRALPFHAGSVDALVLSHAHIDHSGAVPLLVKSGFHGPIHTTPATADLCRVMLLDSAHIQEKDAEFLNRKHGRRGPGAFRPLYDTHDVERTIDLFQPQPYAQPFEVRPDLHVTFHEAGHILGAASVEIRWKENGTAGSLVFSGDLGRPDRPIVRDPEPLPHADHLIIEGTYGGKTHPDDDSLLEGLEQVVKTAVEQQGRIVIPAFAVGRAQEVVHALNRLENERRIPQLPIFMDSPLATEVQAIVSRHTDIFDEETRAAMARGEDPLGLRRVTYVRDGEESKKLNFRQGTFVTIAASGMAEAGRILHHLKHTVEDSRHVILIVGYQAEGTLGKRLVDGVPEVKIFGEPYTVRAKVVVLNGFSAHADHPALVAQATSCAPRAGCAIVHADLPRAEALRAGLPPTIHARIPTEGETWDLR